MTSAITGVAREKKYGRKGGWDLLSAANRHCSARFCTLLEVSHTLFGGHFLGGWRYGVGGTAAITLPKSCSEHNWALCWPCRTGKREVEQFEVSQAVTHGPTQGCCLTVVPEQASPEFTGMATAVAAAAWGSWVCLEYFPRCES